MKKTDVKIDVKAKVEIPNYDHLPEEIQDTCKKIFQAIFDREIDAAILMAQREYETLFFSLEKQFSLTPSGEKTAEKAA